MGKHQPDFVFHLAAYGVQARDRDPRLALDINVGGSVSVLEACASAHVSAVLQVGTSHEYGGSPSPIPESHPLQPAGIYGATKAAAMIVGRTLATSLGVRWVGLRPFVTFGPGEDRAKLVPYVITTALAGKPIKTSVTTQVRDLIYVADLVEGMALAANSNVPAGTVLNLATGHGRSLREFLTEIASYIPGATLDQELSPPRGDDVENQVADTRNAARWIPEWKPRSDLTGPIAATVDSFRNSMERP